MAEEQVKVELLSVSAVVPAIPTVKHQMFLSNLDLFWIPFNQVQRLLFYKTSQENEFARLVEMLKRSLSLVLVEFYPLAGRLGDQSGRPEVDCNDAGVEFIAASIDMPFEDLEKDGFQYKSFFKQLVRTHTDGLEQENYGAPLLSIQVTAFRGGAGICMGTTLHHVIADGNSFWHFMKCWAECSRGVPISKNPEHMRTIFNQDEKNYAIPNISLRAEEVVTDRIKEAQIFKFLPDDLSPMNWKPPAVHEKQSNTVDVSMDQNIENSVQTSVKGDTDQLEISTFHFSEGVIQKLKDRAGALTSFVAVAAHFWRCVMKAREIPEKEHVIFGLLADCRSRVKPPSPSTYFGNCLCVGVAQTTIQQLLGQDICFAAALIHELIRGCAKEAQLNNMIDWLNESPGSGIVRFITHFGSVSRNCVNVVSSAKFPVYESDYGWGKPASVQAASINEIGAMVLFPGRNTAGIDLSTCLPRRHMETLKRILMIIPD